LQGQAFNSLPTPISQAYCYARAFKSSDWNITRADRLQPPPKWDASTGRTLATKPSMDFSGSANDPKAWAEWHPRTDPSGLLTPTGTGLLGHPTGFPHAVPKRYRDRDRTSNVMGIISTHFSREADPGRTVIADSNVRVQYRCISTSASACTDSTPTRRMERQ
jgi:hypothetical protein